MFSDKKTATSGNQVQVSKYGLMAATTSAVSVRVSRTDTAFTIGSTGRAMKVTGLPMKCLVKALSNGLMAVPSLANSRTA